MPSLLRWNIWQWIPGICVLTSSSANSWVCRTSRSVALHISALLTYDTDTGPSYFLRYSLHLYNEAARHSSTISPCALSSPASQWEQWLRACIPDLDSQFYYSVAVWPQVTYLTVCLSFLIYQSGVIIVFISCIYNINKTLVIWATWHYMEISWFFKMLIYGEIFMHERLILWYPSLYLESPICFIISCS